MTSSTQTAVATPDSTRVPVSGLSRGYLTTPQELLVIKEKAERGLEPYQTVVADVLAWADKKWDFELDAHERCRHSDDPGWNDNQRGTAVLYAKALAYPLTGQRAFAEDVKSILQRIMTEVKTIASGNDFPERQCQLNFGWGAPELVAAADLIEDYWKAQSCTGPTSILYTDTTIGTGDCKDLFQNWLVKNPYYVVSYAAESSQSNWGAAATNATAYIADYLWDRPEVLLIHRSPEDINHGEDFARTPAEAYAHANQLALDRMNGYRVGHGSDSCDELSGPQESGEWPPVKSQITELGIIPDDARREEYCNIPEYNGEYQNYPQIHLGNAIQQCELMLRRGDRSCFDNLDHTEMADYTYLDANGVTRTTHLYPGRGSVERAIKAIIVDSNTEWRHDSALEVAYRYYFANHTLTGIEEWLEEIGRPTGCGQDVCFGSLSHGFAAGENPALPPVVPPP